MSRGSLPSTRTWTASVDAQGAATGPHATEGSGCGLPYLRAKVILSSTEGLGGSANLSYHGLSINREMDAMVPAALLPTAWAWGEALWGKGTPAG